MSYQQIFDALGNSIYVAQAAVALYGGFLVVLLVRRIKEKRFATEQEAQQFLTDVGQELKQRNYDGVAQLCDSPPYWSKAVPQLILVALSNLDRGPTRLRRLLAETFEREVISDLEYRMAWISTLVKSAPMLGLLGTVMGMISAFAKIAASQQTGADPKALADDISLALWTTAVGLMIAVPLVLASAMIHVRIGKLQDAVQHHLGVFLDDLDAATASAEGRP